MLDNNERLSVLDTLQTEISTCAKAHGWYADAPISPVEMAARFMLIVTEVAEAVAAIRNGNPKDEHCPEFGNMEIECADAVIRLFSFAGEYGFSLGNAILAKMKANTLREYRHGGKAL
jgi:NTP pyrophosphatase (non-canonical NTP hydrolase)